jgi:UDP-3-O-[3-hydroxymyristoyl] glucosamine N-acyltransferase
MLRASLHENEIRQAIGASGKGDRIVNSVATLDALTDNCLCFINGRITADSQALLATLTGCIIIAPAGSSLADALPECLVLEDPDPRAAIAKVLNFIRLKQRQAPWVAERKIAPGSLISSLAVIEGNVEIGEGTIVEPFCVVGPDVRIGAGTILRSGAKVFPHVTIGDECLIGANSVIGHQGYGFVKDDQGNKTRMPHLGGVVIGSHVEIGALTTVPGGTIAPTIIEDHAKIDDHVHVGHNVRVARGASVTAAVIIGGHSVIGEEAWVGVNSSIREGLRVGTRALVGMDVSLQQELADEHVARAPRPDVRPRPDDGSTGIGFNKR